MPAKKKPTKKTTQASLTTQEEKEMLMNDLKKTLKDVGRLPRLIFAPVIAYIWSKYEKIPADRREKLQEIVASMKKWWKWWIESLKKWFSSMKSSIEESTEKAPVKKKPAVKKKTTVKKKTATTKKKTTTTKKKTVPKKKST